MKSQAKEAKKQPDILILGVGNDILMDDGIGVKLVKMLEKEFPDPAASYETCMMGGFDVLDLMVGYAQVIIIDAIKTRGGTPGDIYHLVPEDFKETLHLSNIHDVSFLQALKFAKKMNLAIPRKIDIIAIEIVEDRVFGDEFTPQLQIRYPEIKEQVTRMVRELIES